MKNYYDQQQELEILKMRISTKNEEKEIYFNETQPSSPEYGEKVSQSHKPSEPFLKYVAKVSEIDDELEELNKRKDILEKYLKLMEARLRDMKGIHERIFVARYIDNMDVRRIAMKVNYSEPHVYRLLGEVNRILKDDKK